MDDWQTNKLVRDLRESCLQTLRAKEDAIRKKLPKVKSFYHNIPLRRAYKYTGFSKQTNKKLSNWTYLFIACLNLWITRTLNIRIRFIRQTKNKLSLKSLKYLSKIDKG